MRTAASASATAACKLTIRKEQPEEIKKDEPKKEEPKKEDKKVVDQPKKKAKDKGTGGVVKGKEEPKEPLNAPALEFRGSGRDFTCVSFSPDGKTLAAGNLEGLVKIWDVAGNKEIAELKTPKGVLSASPSAATAASWRPDRGTSPSASMT